jgi:hypothetical protein
MRRSGRRGNGQIRLRIGSHYPCGLSLGLSAVSKSENAALGDKVAFCASIGSLNLRDQPSANVISAAALAAHAARNMDWQSTTLRGPRLSLCTVQSR